MKVCEWIHVLDFGAILAAGTRQRDPAEPGGARRLPRRGMQPTWREVGAAAPGAVRRPRRLRPHRGAARRRPRRARAAASSRSARPQRRRQVDDARRSCQRPDDADRRVRPHRRAPRERLATPTRLAASAVCTMPEGRGIFPNLTVTENLRMVTFAGTVDLARGRGQGLRPVPPAGGAAARSSPARMSGGEQQMLAHGPGPRRAPGAAAARRAVDGPRPLIVEELYEIVAQIGRRAALSILVVEQFARTVLAWPTTPPPRCTAKGCRWANWPTSRTSSAPPTCGSLTEIDHVDPADNASASRQLDAPSRRCSGEIECAVLFVAARPRPPCSLCSPGLFPRRRGHRDRRRQPPLRRRSAVTAARHHDHAPRGRQPPRRRRLGDLEDVRTKRCQRRHRPRCHRRLDPGRLLHRQGLHVPPRA